MSQVGCRKPNLRNLPKKATRKINIITITKQRQRLSFYFCRTLLNEGFITTRPVGGLFLHPTSTGTNNSVDEAQQLTEDCGVRGSISAIGTSYANGNIMSGADSIDDGAVSARSMDWDVRAETASELLSP